jgi:hypothetical protein
MRRSLFGHSYKRQGMPRAPVSMAQLKREGRLQRKRSSAKQTVYKVLGRVTKGKMVTKTVRVYRWTF